MSELGEQLMGLDSGSLKNILEGAMLAAGQALSLDQMQALFPGDDGPDKSALRTALDELREDCAGRGVELVEVASGWRLQVRQELQPWVSRLWEERPPRYSRALLETLALIAYRQPVTRGDIEEVRGVSVSTHIVRSLEEREWIRVLGHRDIPGKPALYGTTKAFLDYFGLKSLEELPNLAELKDIDALEPELDFAPQESQASNDDDQQDEPEAAQQTREAEDDEEHSEAPAKAHEEE